MAKINPYGLTDAQLRFCDEYLIDQNATRAYKSAYPRVKKEVTAAQNGWRLLRNAKAQAYLTAKQAEHTARYDITQKRTLEEEACIAFSNVAELFNAENGRVEIQSLPDRVQRAISKVEFGFSPTSKTEFVKKVWFHDKGRALERLEKYLGMFERDNRQRNPSFHEVFSALSITSPEIAEAVKAELKRRFDSHVG